MLTPPLASAIAMMAAASITHERGFHMNPRNFKNLLSYKKKKKKLYSLRHRKYNPFGAICHGIFKNRTYRIQSYTLFFSQIHKRHIKL